jgi:flavin-dependent dehydrogenase
LLKRQLPDLRVLIIERRVAFDKKVGESTSEVAGNFLTQVLHLSGYLAAHHINKHGLRLWFTQPGNTDPYACTEVGPSFQSRLPTYQLDRSRLDQHLLDQAVSAGCELVRPAKVKAVKLAAEGDDAPQVIDFTDGSDTPRQASARWVLDASGKVAVLGRQLGLHRSLGDEHPTAALWCRFSNVNDLDSATTRHMGKAFPGKVWAARSIATNHLMGHGWWCWLIPLSDGTLSAGIVWDHTVFDLPPGPSLQERLQRHLLSHPVGKLLFEHATALPDDTHYHKNPAYYSPQMLGHRWALLGDAAGFIDPLYSQGLDYCGHTIAAVTDLLTKEFKGQDTSAEKAYLSGEAYGRSYRYWFEALYKGKYHYMGDAELMWAAFLMDLACYFIGPVRLVYSNPSYEWLRLPYDGKAGRTVAKFMAFYNRRLVHLGQQRQAKGIFGKDNLHHSYLLVENFSPNQKSLGLLWKGMKVWLKAEWSTYFAKSQAPELTPELTPQTVG